MPLKTLVKVGNITNLSDARYCAGMGVEMLGFNVVEGTRGYISPASFQEIRGWLSGPAVVAELYSATINSLASVLENYHPDYFELGVHELPLIPETSTTPIILSVDANSFIAHQPEITRWKHRIRFLVISHSDYINNVTSFLKGDFDILVAVNNESDVTNVTEDPGIKGIVLLGGQEIRPGLKDFDSLATVLERLDTD